jgi:hypothetical protein
MTGLSLTDGSGCLKDELPPITTFLNRLLALTIAMQNVLFTVFEQLLSAKVESAIAAGSYDVGLETLVADSFTVTAQRADLHPPGNRVPRPGCSPIAMRERNQPVSLDKALDLAAEPGARLLVNARSKRAAVQLPARSVMLDDGEVERRVRLIRPMEKLNFALNHLPETSWEAVDEATFAATWHAELAQVDEFAPANCTSSPACCSRSGSSFLRNRPAFIGSRPTMAVALLGAGSLRHGQRVRQPDRTPRYCRRRRHWPFFAKVIPFSTLPMACNCAVRG